ncbi:MAG: tripartite tricarboxylate transporter TctB family protein [Aminivibrio sp.]|uniref:tripartite tricarboxylate transporter TctB family protein n=1 Tax=Aminivibrio sp. TaxID=1872489 RepID=UPI002B21BFFB|nr:tripartite tricarboxylate transporter TctB family protein [Aminivibrio sp.]MEA4952243.1 tripartite tricarboxylate transporter TctB family protein [Aminivibrio sp.]
MEKKDLTSGIVLVLTGAAFFAGSLLLPWKDTGYDWFGAPGLVPAILAALLVLCGLRLILRSRKEPDFYARLSAAETPLLCSDEDEEDVSGEGTAHPAWMHREGPRAVLTVTLCCAYVLLLGRVPYMAATAAFITGFILLFRGAGILKALFIGGAASVSIWFVFYKIFAVFLP